MPGDFFDKITELQDRVGEGHLVGTVEYDQVYAAVQEVGFWVSGPNAGKVIHNHPGGGGIMYLGGALVEGSSDYMEAIAKTVLDDGGPKDGMIAASEKLGEEASARAPIEFGDLRESSHPTVTDDGATVYDRAPLVPRLDESALEAKAKGRTRGDYRRSYLPKDHPAHGTIHPAGKGA